MTPTTRLLPLLALALSVSVPAFAERPAHPAVPEPGSERLNALLNEGREEEVIRLAAAFRDPGARRFWTALALFQQGDKRADGLQHSATEEAYAKAFEVWGKTSGFPGVPPSQRGYAYAAMRFNLLAKAQAAQGKRDAAAASYRDALTAVNLVEFLPEVRRSPHDFFAEPKMLAAQREEAEKGLAALKP